VTHHEHLLHHHVRDSVHTTAPCHHITACSVHSFVHMHACNHQVQKRNEIESKGHG
jgi:hypothetical protein